MRLSATQAATGALTAAVVAGLLLLPGQLLGTDPGPHTAITLPVTTAPAPVHAAPVVVARRHARKVAASPVVRPAPAPAPVFVSAPVRVAPTAVRRSTTAPARPRTTVKPAVRPALVARLITSKAVRAALAHGSNRVRTHETAPPAPTPASPAPAPAPAPAPPPAQAPAAVPTAAQPTIVAGVEQPVIPLGDGLRQGNGDDQGNGGGNGHGHAPWDRGSGSRDQNRDG